LNNPVPPEIEARIKLAGGTNPFGEPLFRIIWGFDRIVKIHGQWHDTMKVETREEPKYLPGDRWHLEMWRPPEEYGSPENWGKQGEEVIGHMTIDTSGPYPHRGEYELCYTISSDLTPSGAFVPLNATVVELLVNAIRLSRNEAMSLVLRKSAIRQRLERERRQRIEEGADILLDARPAFYDTPTSFSTGPKKQKLDNPSKIWMPN
jgi:hypothetical protein